MQRKDVQGSFVALFGEGAGESGQVYLQSSRPAGQGGILFQGNTFFDQKGPCLSAANAVASITVQEKLMAAGLEKMRLLFPKFAWETVTASSLARPPSASLAR